MVVAAHMNGVLAKEIPLVPYWLYIFWGALGVQMFFVLSGFLITHLLLKELNKTGTLSLKRFYFRRTLRIFPPLYAYLAVSLVLTHAGLFAGTLPAFAVAATYTSNYFGGGSELLEHTWSLSLEEQFYLLWPAALLFLRSERSIKLAVWVILLSPFSRIATYYLMPHHRALLNGMLHTGLDSIMFGCLLALLQRNERFNRLIKPYIQGPAALAATVFVLILGPMVQSHFRGSYGLVIGFTLNAICLSQIVLYVVRFPQSPPGRVLNTRLLRHVGMISYSLYLWQHMFTRPNSTPFVPWNLAAIFLCAELSYWLVERPSFWLRDRLEHGTQWNQSISQPAQV